MKYAFCNELFKDWEVESMVGFLAGLGYSGVEIAPWTYFSCPEDRSDAGRIGETIRANALEVVGLHWLFGSPMQRKIKQTSSTRPKRQNASLMRSISKATSQSRFTIYPSMLSRPLPEASDT